MDEELITFKCICCELAIKDKYIYKVTNDLYVHESCLVCNECGTSMKENTSCYIKSNKIYCKNDYLKLYSTITSSSSSSLSSLSCNNKCTRCNLYLKSNDLVMRFKSKKCLMYHMDCFYCDLCSKKLHAGDEFQLKENNLLICKEDSFIMYQQHTFNNSLDSLSTYSPCSNNSNSSGNSCNGGGVSSTLSIDSPQLPLFHNLTSTYSVSNTNTNSNNNNNNNNNNILEYDYQTIDEDTDVDDENDNNDNNNDDSSSEKNISIKKHHLMRHKQSSLSSSSSSNSPSPSPPAHMSQSSMYHNCSITKPARIRTVLNEKQLHTLRACYGANPRPDALMKEQLVEMTGLSPRVIRVWFQNKRCKDKKKTMLVRPSSSSSHHHHHHHLNDQQQSLHSQIMFDNCF